MNIRLGLIASLLLLYVGAGLAYAEELKTPQGFVLGAEGPTPTGRVVGYRKAIESAVTQHTLVPGLLPLYWNAAEESLKIEVPKALLGVDLVLYHAMENGVPALGHFRGSYNSSAVVQWRQRGPRLELIKLPQDVYFAYGSPLTRAADANLSPAILWSLPIEVEDKDTGGLLADISSVLRTEKLLRLRPPKEMMDKKKITIGGVNAGSSHILAARNYADNTDIVVELSYEAADAEKALGKEQADPRHLLVQYQVSFVRPPATATAFQARPADHRVGYFQTIGYDMTALDPRPWRDFIYRWDLQPEAIPEGGYRATKPIVWWIENTTPYAIRGVIRAAILRWNQAFAAAGISDAIQVRVQPDDADWDAGDLHYNTIRWVSSLRPPFGGYGPAFVDPRTGQILGADITLEYSYLYKRTRSWEAFGNPDAQTPACLAGQRMAMQRQLAEAMMPNGTSDPVTLTPALESGLYYLLMHEVGHTLGLTHNFKGSTWLPMQAVATGTSAALQASVMDYPSPNFTHRYGGKPERLFTRDLGPYDFWAIVYGYSPGATEAESERTRLAAIAARSTEPGHAYANDSDDMRAPGKGIDPRAQIFDFSSEPLAWAEDRFLLYDDFLQKLAQEASTSPVGSLREWIGVLRTAYDHNALIVAQYTNGAFVERHAPGSASPDVVQQVPPEQVLYAMDILRDHALPMRFVYSLQDLLPRLAPERRGFSGTGPGVVYPAENISHTMHSRLLDVLLHPEALQRLENLRGMAGGSERLSALQMMDQLQEHIMGASLPSLDDPHMWLQQDWVAALVKLYKRPATDKIPATVRGHAEHLLETLNNRWHYPLRASNIQAAHQRTLQQQVRQALGD